MIMKGKQGVAYTLAITLLGTVLLSLSFLVFNTAQSSQSQLVVLGGTQRIYDVEQSIQEVLAKAIAQKTTLRFSPTINSVTFNETLPQNLTNVTDLFSSLKENIERDFSFISLDVTQFNEKYAVIFKPGNIGYVQESPYKIRIEDSAGGVLPTLQGYNITLVFSANITSCVSNIEPGNSLTVSITATSLGSSCIITPTLLKGIELQIVSEGKNVELKIEDDKELVLDSQVTMKSSIMAILQPLSEYGYLEIPITMESNESALRYYRKTNVLIPLWS